MERKLDWETFWTPRDIFKKILTTNQADVESTCSQSNDGDVVNKSLSLLVFGHERDNDDVSGDWEVDRVGRKEFVVWLFSLFCDKFDKSWETNQWAQLVSVKYCKKSRMLEI